MRILMINKFLYPNGGSETYIFKLGDYLKSQGHEVQYFGMEHEGRCVGNSVNAYTSNMDFHGGSKLAKLTYPIKTIYSSEARKKLRLVLEDNDKADIHAIEDVDLVKGVFVAGDQLQIIFGAGLVNDVCQVLADSLHMDSMSLGDLKTKANKRMNPLQRAVKALSDVFIEIMPGILAAALLTGLSSVLGNIDFVQNNDTLYGLSRLINISSGAIFGFVERYITI